MFCCSICLYFFHWNQTFMFSLYVFLFLMFLCFSYRQGSIICLLMTWGKLLNKYPGPSHPSCWKSWINIMLAMGSLDQSNHMQTNPPGVLSHTAERCLHGRRDCVARDSPWIAIQSYWYAYSNTLWKERQLCPFSLNFNTFVF
jgi:hypothetical protein